MEPHTKALFDTISPKLQVLTGVERDSREKIDWVPIVPWVPGVEEYVGLSANGYWLVEGPHGLHLIDRPKCYLFLFRMMERPVSEIVDEISGNANFRGFSDEILEAFPFADIVRTAFRFLRPHWIEYAFSWFENFPLYERVSFPDELEQL